MKFRPSLSVRVFGLGLSLGLATLAACSNSDSGLTTPDGGVDPMAVLTPTVQSFGRIAPGATSALFKFTVSNIGFQPTGAVSLSLDGNTNDFQIMSSTCGGPLAMAATCEVSLVFVPMVVGTRNARLIVKTSPGGIVIATLSGIGQVPAGATITPSNPDFGSLLASSATNPATPSKPSKQVLILKNSGGVPIGPFAIDISGKDATDFAVTDSSACMTSVQPSEMCGIEVSFRPATPGVKSATLNATSSDGSLKLIAALGGTGTDQARLALLSMTLPLAPVAVGMSSVGTLRLQNTGGAVTGKIGFTLTGANTSEFAVDAKACDTVNPGDICSITVTFSPMQPGAKTASLRADASPGGTVSADITATAMSASSLGMLTLTATGAQPFGTVPVGGISTALFIVENKGIAAVGKVSASTGGVNLGEFMVTENLCPMTLDAGASCTITVSFMPQASGTRNAIIQVSASPGSFASLAISADAVDGATLTLSPETRNFGNLGVNAGNSNPVTFTVTNSGETVTGPVAVTLEGADNGNFNISFTDCTGVTLQKDKTCRVDVRFNPVSVGNKIASLTVTATPGGVARSSLYGNGN